MDLYVIRHAIAEPRPSEPDPAHPDPERALTDEGRRRFRLVVRGLARLEVGFDRVLTSPWLRATQTAELLAPLAQGPVHELVELAREPDADLATLLDGIDGRRVALVGHEPWLSDLVGWLVTGDPALGFPFALKKGGVAHLEGRPLPGAMRLAGFWRPAALRVLGQRE